MQQRDSPNVTTHPMRPAKSHDAPFLPIRWLWVGKKAQKKKLSKATFSFGPLCKIPWNPLPFNMWAVAKKKRKYEKSLGALGRTPWRTIAYSMLNEVCDTLGCDTFGSVWHTWLRHPRVAVCHCNSCRVTSPKKIALCCSVLHCVAMCYSVV